jgi:hypothetical protein
MNGDMVYSAHFKHLRDLEPLFPVWESYYKVLKRSCIEPKSVRGEPKSVRGPICANIFASISG